MLRLLNEHDAAWHRKKALLSPRPVRSVTASIGHDDVTSAFALRPRLASGMPKWYTELLFTVLWHVQALVASGKSFFTTDYMLPTPDWAVYGAEEAGFDPQEVRFKKIRNHPGKLASNA